jgi:hypothetical protein
VAGHVALLLLKVGENAMAFNNSSYFAGVGTVVAAISLGFAGGAMITTSAVQPPNRLERVTSTATPPSAPSSATLASTVSSSPVSQQTSVTTPAAQPPAQVQAAAPTAPAIDSLPVQQPQPAAPVAAKSDVKTDAATNIQQPPPSPPQAARNEDAAPAKNDRANAHPAEPNREASRKHGEERKFSERKRRQDLDQATNVVRQMPRDGAVDRVAEEDDAPRVIDGPPRRFGLFGNDEDSPRAPPPRFGLFGN